MSPGGGNAGGGARHQVTASPVGRHLRNPDRRGGLLVWLVEFRSRMRPFRL
jgi:hypothetical protein